jgi:hypothetical protein
MASPPAAEQSQYAYSILSILRGNIRVYDAQMESFENLRNASLQNPQIAQNQLKAQILTSFVAISRLRREQRQICQNCIDLFNNLSKVQSPEEYANITQVIEASLSQLEKLEQDFLKYVPLLEEAKHTNDRTMTKV